MNTCSNMNAVDKNSTPLNALTCPFTKNYLFYISTAYYDSSEIYKGYIIGDKDKIRCVRCRDFVKDHREMNMLCPNIFSPPEKSRFNTGRCEFCSFGAICHRIERSLRDSFVYYCIVMPFGYHWYKKTLEKKEQSDREPLLEGKKEK